MRFVSSLFRLALLCSLLSSLFISTHAQSPAPVIQSVTHDPIGGGVTDCLTGTGFGTTRGTSTILLNGAATPAPSPDSWTDTSACFVVPSGTALGAATVQVVTSAGSSNVLSVTVVGPPLISSISPSAAAPGAQITISGSNFGASQSLLRLWIGTSPNFNDILYPSISSWTDTQIVATIPSSASVGNQTVQIAAASGLSTSTAAPNLTIVGPPIIQSVSFDPVGGGVEECVVGSGFGTTRGASTILLNGAVAPAPSPDSWADTRACFIVPASTALGAATVQVVTSVGSSNVQNFTVVGPPVISSISPSAVAPGAQITINGSSFGAIHILRLWIGTSPNFNDILSPSVISWTDTQIVATVPSSATVGNQTVQIAAASGLSTSTATPNLTIIGPPVLQSVTHDPIGGGVTDCLTGTGFGTTRGTGTILLNGAATSVPNPDSWTDTNACFVVPSGTALGAATVQAVTSAGSSNLLSVTVVGSPVISSISPSAAAPGAQITISGSNFGASQSLLRLWIGTSPNFNNILYPSISSWTDTQIVATIPSSASVGNQTVQIAAASGLSTSTATPNLTIVGPPALISSIAPTSGTPGTPVTITGSNFGSTQGASSVTFNGVAASVTSWSDTSISAAVPVGTSSGGVVVSVGAQESNSVAFTVLNGAIVGSYSPAVTSVTLTSSSVLDWAHWGTSDAAPFVTSVQFLSDFSTIGTSTPTRFTDGEIEYSWTDGDLVATTDRTTTGVSVTGTGNGFHLSIPADTIPQTLLLYVGAWEAQGQLTASLSDSSAPSFTDSSVDIVSANGDHHVNGTYTLTFQSNQPGQTLNIDYILATDHGAASGLAGYVSLQSAVLLPAQPTVALTSPVNGQTFTYPSDVPLAASASQVGAAISTVSFSSDSLKMYDAVSGPYSFGLGGLTPGDHTLTATATDSNGVSTTSAPVVIAEVATGGVLSGSADTPVNVDLSAGTSDWIHWGGTVPDRKAGINPQISDLKTLANGSAHSSDASATGGVSYSWNSGTPTDSQAGTATEMRMTGYKNGFNITVAADSTLRTLKLYTSSASLLPQIARCVRLSCTLRPPSGNPLCEPV